MTFKTESKSKPAWLIGGLIGQGIYICAVLTTLLIFKVIGPLVHKNPHLLPPGSLIFIFLMIIISFYPGILFAASYKALAIIVPLNLIAYFVLGALFGIAVSKFCRFVNQMKQRLAPTQSLNT
ncbi:MAG TPA: hypothetical protein VJH68_04285 [Candidatus Nanoarchaeia archaeon]|nr:hypothetical protein [Candidatus Nanoarchaeia archaeon]